MRDECSMLGSFTERIQIEPYYCIRESIWTFSCVWALTPHLSFLLNQMQR